MTDRPTLAVAAGTAFLGRELTPVSDAVVLVRGREIVAAGPRREVRIPDGAEIVEVTEGTIVPGFMDCHVHIGFAEPAEVLRRGVTVVRDLAWPRDDIYPLARASTEDGFAGPLVLTAGPMLTAPGGYPITAAWAPPGTGLAVDSPDAGRKAVAELAREGVHIVKVALNPPAGDVLDATTLGAIVDEAHRCGLRVTGHIHGIDELHKALDAGIDELAHMLMSPEAIPDGTIRRMVDADVVVVPTLSIFPADQANVAISNVRAFVEAGGRVVYGTDLGNAGPGPGIDALEVGRMEKAGMTAIAIVRSATADAAAWLGLDKKGSLAPGMDADIVCLEGAIENASDLTRVVGVMREGRVAA